MNPFRARWALACGLFAWTAAFSLALQESPARRSESGLAIFETPDAWRPYVSGPVTAFARSADDMLFVGSNRLTVFDGYSWSDIAVPGATAFRALVTSRDGHKIWIGAANGVVGYVERNDRGEWIYHSLNAALALARARHPGDVRHVHFGDIRHIHLDGDRVLFVARESILRWNPPTPAAAGHFEVWNLPSDVRLYAFSDHGRLLLYQMGAGLLRMEENGPKLWLAEKVLPSRPPMVAYLSVPDGGEFAVFNDEVFRHEGGRWIRLDEASHVLHDKRAQRALVMPDGRMAIGTAYGGCILLRSDGTVLRVLDGQSGLPDVNVVRLWADPEDQLWIGLWTGFVRLSGLGLASLYDQRLGFVAFVPHKVLRIDGDLTVISSQGVYTMAPSLKSFETSSFTRQEEYFRQLWDGVDLDGQLWLGASDGLWKVSGGKVVREPAVSAGIFFLSTLRALPHGLVFFDGVACKAWLSGQHGWELRDLHQRLESSPAATMEDFAGRLWVATQGGQIHRFDWDNAAQRLQSGAHYSLGHGFPFPGVRPVLIRLRDRIFVRTEDGILALDPARDRFVPASQFNDLDVLAAAPAADGSAYWIVQRKELGAMASRALLRIKLGRRDSDPLELTALIAPGLDQVGDVTSLNLTSSANQEELWIGGDRALLRLETALLRPAGAAPAVRLQSLRVDAKHLAAIGGGSSPVFIPSVSRLEFALSAGAAAINEGPFLYQTKLEGIERDWSPPQSEPRREFTGLSPGAYVFAARAIDALGQPGPPLRFPFAILTPWYRRPLALAAWALAGVLLVWGGLKIRLRKLHGQAERLNRLVTERTRELSLSNTAKSEFLENISHEIRNPLNGITGLIRLFDENELSERQRQNARALKECSESLSRVFDEVLNFSKLEYGYVPVEDRGFLLAELLETVRDLFRAEAIERGVSLSLRLPADFDDGFRGDGPKLRTIISNFVGNALKYAPGGPVEIVAACLAGTGGVDNVLIEVTDHGLGVPADEQELIFKKFVRGSRARLSAVPGTGIGLATCRAMARLMGGSVGIESQPGQGATFFVRMPLRRIPAAPVPVALAAGAPAQGFALIVDDQHYNQLLLAEMVGQLGFEAVCAFDLAEALAAASQRRFAVAFLDIELPRVKGPEIARQLRELLGDSRPLLIGASANGSDEAVRSCFAAGMDSFLAKPFRLDTLRSALAGARQRRDGDPAPATPVFDPTALNLYARCAPGGMGAAAEAFLHSLRKEINSLNQVLRATPEPEAVAQAAHRVRSHAAVGGAVRLAEAAAILETEARAGQLANALVSFGQIQQATIEVEMLLSVEVSPGLR